MVRESLVVKPSLSVNPPGYLDQRIDVKISVGAHALVLMAAGLCQAALQALRRQITTVSGRTLALLHTFFKGLSSKSQSSAMTVLVAGDVVELAMAHLADAGSDNIQCGVHMLEHFRADSRGRERLCAPRVVDQLMKWIAKWLAEVRGSLGG